MTGPDVRQAGRPNKAVAVQTAAEALHVPGTFRWTSGAGWPYVAVRAGEAEEIAVVPRWEELKCRTSPRGSCRWPPHSLH